MSTAPAALLGLADHGALSEGAAANVVVLDPEAEWRVDPGIFYSGCGNTPLGGRTLKGLVRHTFFRGRQTVSDGKVLKEVVV
jgi:dihydroorotase